MIQIIIGNRHRQSSTAAIRDENPLHCATCHMTKLAWDRGLLYCTGSCDPVPFPLQLRKLNSRVWVCVWCLVCSDWRTLPPNATSRIECRIETQKHSEQHTKQQETIKNCFTPFRFSVFNEFTTTTSSNSSMTSTLIATSPPPQQGGSSIRSSNNMSMYPNPADEEHDSLPYDLWLVWARASQEQQQRQRAGRGGGGKQRYNKKSDKTSSSSCCSLLSNNVDARAERHMSLPTRVSLLPPLPNGMTPPPQTQPPRAMSLNN